MYPLSITSKFVSVMQKKKKIINHMLSYMFFFFSSKKKHLYEYFIYSKCTDPYVLTVCPLFLWYLILSHLSRLFWPSQNQIFLDSFHRPRECYLLSNPYGQHIIVNNCEGKEALELFHQLCAHVLSSLVVLPSNYLQKVYN